MKLARAQQETVETEMLSSCPQSKGKYEVATGSLKSPDELVDCYQTLIGKYPAVVALIDPFRREVSLKHILIHQRSHFMTADPFVCYTQK